MTLNSPLSNTPKTPLWLHVAIWTLACVLLALVQLPWAGYQLGVGNQGIQIAFLEKLHNRELFSNDPMVAKTLGSYPSFFFHFCAKLLGLLNVELPTLYLGLHILATAGVFGAVAGLSRAMTRNAWTSVVCVLMLLAGHHQALAGETLYSPGFTHTWAIFPLSLLALYLFFKDRVVAAFLLAGLIFNFHALEAGHLLLIMGFAAVLDIRRVGFRTLVAGSALFLLAAGPTIAVMVKQSQHLTPEQLTLWLQLMHIRSADHSFPSSWWQEGMSDLPRFASILGLAAVALGFRFPPRMKRRTLLVVAAIGILFLIGTIFTDVHPVALVIRAQFFRSSRLLLIIALILIAHGCAVAFGLPWKKITRPGGTGGFPLDNEIPEPTKTWVMVPKWGAWLEFGNALFTLACLAIPSMGPALPLALGLALMVALVNGRLAWYEALFAGCSLMVCMVAFQTIQFVIPGLSPGVTFKILLGSTGPSVGGWGLLFLALILAVVAVRKLNAKISMAALGGGALCTLLALVLVVPGIRQRSEPDREWIEVQQWAKAHTPASALFLTRTQDSGFRIYSERGVVGEWRDGTQLYFSGTFADDWWKRMNALQPGIVVNVDGKTLLSRGKPLDQLDDEQIVKLAQDFHASYIVLPRNDRHYMEKAGFQNGQWTVFKPKLAELGSVNGDLALPEENKFLQQTALPNIEKYRKSDAQLTIVDAAGKPVQGVAYKVAQVSSNFGFGVSLSFFDVPKVDTKADYLPPKVTPGELTLAKDVFNYSVIPFSGQWRFFEPVEGKLETADLDGYVEWCVQNAVRPEFRFIAGYQPSWFRGRTVNDQGPLLLKHARDLAQRYAGKIKDWQVTSEEVGLKETGVKDPVNVAKTTAFFTELRKLLPNAQLGISDDARFWSPPLRTGTAAQEDMLRGIETLRALKKANVAVDYFALEAKHPLGLWAGGKQIYDTLDAFAKEGVKIHITEFGVVVGDRIEGSVRDGVWDEKTRAEYYERFFTICFSHPSVDVINVMGIGPKTWIEGQGLLDDKYAATPTYSRLKELITQRWRTQKSDTLSASGMVTFRGFQGGYVLSITLADGKVVTAPFNVMPLAAGADVTTLNTYRFTLNTAAGTLSEGTAGGH